MRKQTAVLIVLAITVAVALSYLAVSAMEKAKPVLKYPLVNISDFAHDRPEYLSEYGALMPFGAKLYNERGEYESLSPTYEYYIKDETVIKSPLDGVVTRTEYQPEDMDYYVWIKPARFSLWIVEIDHLKNLRVNKGDKIRAGEAIGTAGNWYPDSGVGRTELMILKKGIVQYYYCPALFAEENLREHYKAIAERFTKTNDNMEEPACLYRILRDKSSKDKKHLEVEKR